MISRNEAKLLAQNGAMLAATVFACGVLIVAFPGHSAPPPVLIIAATLGSLVWILTRDLVTGESWRDHTWFERALMRRRNRR